jgi:hypothetical protein
MKNLIWTIIMWDGKLTLLTKNTAMRLMLAKS